MSLFDSTEVRRYRYKVSQCTLILGGETINVKSDAVGGMMIEERYIEDMYPIFRVNIATDKATYYKISQFKTTMRVHLTIQKYSVSMDSAGKITRESAKQIWINDDFCTISKDITVNKSRDLDLAKSNHGVNEGDAENRDCVSELYLWRVEIANGFKKVLNKVVKQSTLSSVVTWMLYNAGITNCLMSPLENNERYEEILIPPLPINRNLQHMDGMYGFYKYGAIIFFGLKYSYILNFNDRCTVWARNEVQNVTILIPKATANESGSDGGTVDRGGGNSHYIYARYMDVDFGSPNTVDNVTKGTDAMVIQKSTASITKASGKGMSNNNQNNTKVISDSTLNKWLATTYAAYTSSNKQVITAMIRNVDLDDLTPNKVFTIAVEDSAQTSKAKGNYKMCSVVHRFSNDHATGDFCVESMGEFRRMEPPA